MLFRSLRALCALGRLLGLRFRFARLRVARQRLDRFPDPIRATACLWSETFFTSVLPGMLFQNDETAQRLFGGDLCQCRRGVELRCGCITGLRRFFRAGECGDVDVLVDCERDHSVSRLPTRRFASGSLPVMRQTAVRSCVGLSVIAYAFLQLPRWPRGGLRANSSRRWCVCGEHGQNRPTSCMYDMSRSN